MAYALDSKSSSRECGFKSHLGHQLVVQLTTQWMDLTHPVLLLREGSRLGFCMRTMANEGSTFIISLGVRQDRKDRSLGLVPDSVITRAHGEEMIISPTTEAILWVQIPHWALKRKRLIFERMV